MLPSILIPLLNSLLRLRQTISFSVFPSIILVLISLFTLPHAERKPVAFGLLGGLGGTSFWGNDVHDFAMDIAPTAGFTLTGHLPEFIGIEIDALYSVKTGSFRKFLNDKQTQVSSVKIHYLEFPLLLKITAPTEGEVHPIFFGGPALSRAIIKKSNTDLISIGSGGIISPETLEPEIKKENIDDFDFSLMVGGGLEWGLGTFQLRLDLGEHSIDKTKALDIKTFHVVMIAGFIF